VSKRVGIVVPTLGERADYLSQCLESIKRAGDAHVCLVAPRNFDYQPLVNGGLVHQFVVDPGSGLPQAINKAFAELPLEIEYVNWLGDDDLLSPESISKAAAKLDSDPETVLVYGSCDYVDIAGRVIWTNKSGQWASTILNFGPDLIPQPGSLFRRSAFNEAGGLSQEFNWAFDFDLLLNLKKSGNLTFLDMTLSSFRWHPRSLSVEFRKRSADEASKVRISHLPEILRPISWLWEYPLRKVTFLAGLSVSKRAKKLSE
jgi:glycosyltransferase involved in cell wall biosynthesis